MGQWLIQQRKQTDEKISLYAIAIRATVTIWGGSFASTKYALAQARTIGNNVPQVPYRHARAPCGLSHGGIAEAADKEAAALFLMGFQGRSSSIRPSRAMQ